MFCRSSHCPFFMASLTAATMWRIMPRPHAMTLSLLLSVCVTEGVDREVFGFVSIFGCERLDPGESFKAPQRKFRKPRTLTCSSPNETTCRRRSSFGSPSLSDIGPPVRKGHLLGHEGYPVDNVVVDLGVAAPEADR